MNPAGFNCVAYDVGGPDAEQCSDAGDRQTVRLDFLVSRDTFASVIRRVTLRSFIASSRRACRIHHAMWAHLLVSVLASCSATPAATAVRGRILSSHTTPPSILSAPASSAGPTAADDIARWKAEFEAFYDVFTAAVARDQVPPPGFEPARLTQATKAPFSPSAVATVHGYAWQHDGGPGQTFKQAGGCRFGVLNADGTLCASTSLPGVEISPANVAELVRAVQSEPVPTEARTCMCGGKTSVMHSFVFYDAQDVPIATITLNLKYHELHTLPRQEPEHLHAFVSSKFRATYADLCSRMGMPLCFIWDSDQYDRFWSELEQKEPTKQELRKRRWQRSPLDALDDRPLNAYSDQGRRALCAWNHASTLDVRPKGESFGREAANGEVWIGRGLPWWECEEQFPRCNRRLSEVLPCQEVAVSGNPGLVGAVPPQCRALRDCIWGYETLKRTPPRTGASR